MSRTRRRRVGGSPEQPALAPAATPPIESLPLVGTTWYDRGWPYWWRRLRTAVAMAAVTAVDVVIIWAFLDRVRTGSPTAFRAIGVAIVAVGVVTGALAWRRSGRPAGPVRRSASEARRAGSLAGAVGATVRAGSVAASLLLVTGAVLTAGPLVALFLRTLQPELPAERRARTRLRP